MKRFSAWLRRRWGSLRGLLIEWLAGNRSIIFADAVIFDGKAGFFLISDPTGETPTLMHGCTFLNVRVQIHARLPPQYCDPKLYQPNSPVQRQIAHPQLYIPIGPNEFPFSSKDAN